MFQISKKKQKNDKKGRDNIFVHLGLHYTYPDVKYATGIQGPIKGKRSKQKRLIRSSLTPHPC